MKKFMFIAMAWMLQVSANAQSGGFLINQSGIDRSALENLNKMKNSQPRNTNSSNSVVVTGYGASSGGYLIDQSSIGGKSADMIVGGGGESSTTGTSTRRSASEDRQRAKQINRQADVTAKKYEEYKKNPNAWSSGAYHSSERLLKSMQKR